MTRIDSVRHAADVTKDSVRHAAEVAAPYANTAKYQAVQYAQQTGALARQQYDDRLAEKVAEVVGLAREQARSAGSAVSTAVPPKAAAAVETAAKRTKNTARTAAVYTVPRVGAAVAVTRSVAGPVTEEAVTRGAAALQALRGQVTAADIDRLVRRRIRRERTGRVFAGLVVVGLAGGVAFAAYKWWSKQANPDWLVEPTEPTGSGERIGGGTLTIVDPLDVSDPDSTASLNGSAPTVDRVDGSPDAAGLDPEVEAKQAEDEEHDEHDGHDHRRGEGH